MFAYEYCGAIEDYMRECTPDYMVWYAKVSRQFIGPAIEPDCREVPQQETPSVVANKVRQCKDKFFVIIFSTFV